MNQNLSDLYRALSGPGEPHLDDAAMATLADAEAAGEDIERLYPSALTHIETCLECAEAYSKLIEMVLEVAEEMSVTASTVDPLAVYAEMLLIELEALLGPLPGTAQLSRHVAARLATHFPEPPSSDKISAETVAAWLAEIAPTTVNPPQISSAVTQAIQHTLSALSLHLENVAESIWGHAIKVSRTVVDNWQVLLLSPGPKFREAILGDPGKIEEQEWPLMNVSVGSPLPSDVTAWAERSSTTACTIFVQIERPGLTSASRQGIELSYSGQTRVAYTDEDGLARFESVPIAAVPESKIRLQI